MEHDSERYTSAARWCATSTNAPTCSPRAFPRNGYIIGEVIDWTYERPINSSDARTAIGAVAAGRDITAGRSRSGHFAGWARA